MWLRIFQARKGRSQSKRPLRRPWLLTHDHDQTFGVVLILLAELPRVLLSKSSHIFYHLIDLSRGTNPAYRLTEELGAVSVATAFLSCWTICVTRRYLSDNLQTIQVRAKNKKLSRPGFLLNRTGGRSNLAFFQKKSRPLGC